MPSPDQVYVSVVAPEVDCPHTVIGSPRRLLVAVAVLAGVVVACAPTTPAPLPSGATPLILKTLPPPGLPALDVGGCASAEIEPVVISRHSDSLLFTSKGDGAVRPLAWPAGFSARRLNGTAELVTPLGNVYGREGDTLSHLAGNHLESGDIAVCFASSDQYKNGPP